MSGYNEPHLESHAAHSTPVPLPILRRVRALAVGGVDPAVPEAGREADDTLGVEGAEGRPPGGGGVVQAHSRGVLVAAGEKAAEDDDLAVDDVGGSFEVAAGDG